MAPLFDRAGPMPPAARFAAILWLSFLMAGVATGIFFSVLDPSELAYCVPFPHISRMAAYTIGFFLFWLLTASSSLLAVSFVTTNNDIQSTDGKSAR